MCDVVNVECFYVQCIGVPYSPSFTPDNTLYEDYLYSNDKNEYPMYFYAGFMTISQDPTTLALRPEIG